MRIKNNNYRCDKLKVAVYPDRLSLGAAAAGYVADHLKRLIAEKGHARVVFACAPSQNEFLAELIEQPEIPWQVVEAFHMDEYVGLPAVDPRSFRYYLREHFLKHIELSEFHPITADASDIEDECKRYAALLNRAPIDLICLGVGENGHIAFNDPPVADFEDMTSIKSVTLDHACRVQQVNDGCFPDIESVPKQALSLTIPVFRNAQKLSIVVPGQLKATAIKNMLEGSVSTNCPASILREHSDAKLFLDETSASLLS